MDASDRLLARVARCGGWAAAALAGSAVADAVAAVLMPALLAEAVDAALGAGGDRRTLILLCALVVIATAAEISTEFLATRVFASTVGDLRHRLVDRVLGLGVQGQRRFETGDLLARVLQGTGQTAAITPTLAMAGARCLTAIGAIVALLLIDWRLPLVLAVGVPLAMLIGRVFLRRSTDISTRYQELHGQLASRFVDAIGGSRTIRASGTLDQEVGRVLAPLRDLHMTGKEMWEAQRQLSWQVSVMTPLLHVAVLSTAGLGVAAGRVTPGQMLAAAAYLRLAMQLFRQVVVTADVGRARAGARRLEEVLGGQGAVRTGVEALPDGPGRLELRGVAAAASGERLLDDVDLDVPPGAMVAIVGRSGTGKSTLAGVAGGLLEPDEGEVLLDGVPLSRLAPEELAAAVGYAFETPNLVGETIADAVGYADPPIARGAVREALRDARAADFVDRLPEGHDTPLREVALSGGERQRLGLARAAARRARLVILDDAMSSLDTATEHEVAEALERGLGRATRLAVAHRVSTAARADLVAWLEGGRIRAVSDHRSLWRDPDYRRLFGAEESAPVQPDERGEVPCPTSR